MEQDHNDSDSEQQLTEKTRKRRRLLKKIIRNNREVASDKEFQILINLDKELFAGWNAHRLGNFCIQENRLQLAEQNLIKANELVQKKFLFTNVYFSLGNLYLKKKNPLKACEYYEKVIQESPHKNSKTYANKDQVVFATRLNSFHAYSESHDQLVKIYLETNQLEKAYNICKESLEFKQQEESCIVSFADAMQKVLGNKSEAINFAWKKLVEETKAKGFEKLVDFKPIEIKKWIKPIKKQKTPKKINISCLKWGSKYTSEHVNKLYAGVKRNTTWDVSFYCFTNDSYGINKDIKIKPLDDEWKKQWGKSVILGSQTQGKNCYIDLDTVITGNLDQLFEYEGQFGTIYGKSREKEGNSHFGYQSCVMIWNGNSVNEVFNGMKENPQIFERLLIKFDYWLDFAVKNGDGLSELYPQKILNFELEFNKELPKNSSIVHFREKPKPQDYPVLWVKTYWTQT